MPEGLQQHWILCFEDLKLGFFWNVRRVSPSLDRGLGLRIPPMCTGETRGTRDNSPDDDGNAMLYLRCWKFTSQQRTSSPGRLKKRYFSLDCYLYSFHS